MSLEYCNLSDNYNYLKLEKFSVFLTAQQWGTQLTVIHGATQTLSFSPSLHICLQHRSQLSYESYQSHQFYTAWSLIRSCHITSRGGISWLKGSHTSSVQFTSILECKQRSSNFQTKECWTYVSKRKRMANVNIILYCILYLIDKCIALIIIVLNFLLSLRRHWACPFVSF